MNSVSGGVSLNNRFQTKILFLTHIDSLGLILFCSPHQAIFVIFVGFSDVGVVLQQPVDGFQMPIARCEDKGGHEITIFQLDVGAAIINKVEVLTNFDKVLIKQFKFLAKKYLKQYYVI